MAKVLSRLTALETNNAELRKEIGELREEIGELQGRNTELQEEMAELRGQNSFLECQLEETDSRLQTTMEAVLGVSIFFCYSYLSVITHFICRTEWRSTKSVTESS